MSMAHVGSKKTALLSRIGQQGRLAQYLRNVMPFDEGFMRWSSRDTFVIPLQKL